MSWGMFGSESPGWSYALAGHHRADLTGTGGWTTAWSPSPAVLDVEVRSQDVAGDLLQAPQHIAGVKGPVMQPVQPA